MLMLTWTEKRVCVVLARIARSKSSSIATYNSLCDDNAPSTVVSGSSADRSEEDARRSSMARAAKDSIESNRGNAVAKMVVLPSPTKPCVDTKRYRVGERRVGRSSEPNMSMNSNESPCTITHEA